MTEEPYAYYFTADDIKRMVVEALIGKAAQWDAEAHEEGFKGAANQSKIHTLAWGSSQLREIAGIISKCPEGEIRLREVDYEGFPDAMGSAKAERDERVVQAIANTPNLDRPEDIRVLGMTEPAVPVTSEVPGRNPTPDDPEREVAGPRIAVDSATGESSEIDSPYATPTNEATFNIPVIPEFLEEEAPAPTPRPRGRPKREVVSLST